MAKERVERKEVRRGREKRGRHTWSSRFADHVPSRRPSLIKSGSGHTSRLKKTSNFGVYSNENIGHGASSKKVTVYGGMFRDSLLDEPNVIGNNRHEISYHLFALSNRCVQKREAAKKTQQSEISSWKRDETTSTHVPFYFLPSFIDSVASRWTLNMSARNVTFPILSHSNK